MNLQQRLFFKTRFLLRASVALCFFLLGAVPCFGQSFTGNGDGFSWNDGDNWFGGNVPSTSNASISGSSVQINSPTGFSGTIRVDSGSLSVNAPLSEYVNGKGQSFGPPTVFAASERATINVNADVFGNISTGNNGGTINLNDGTFTGSESNSNDLFIGNNSSFNQNGGHFNVNFLFLDSTNVTVTVGPNDNITGTIATHDGHLIIDRPINLAGQMSSAGTELTFNDDLACDGSIFITGLGTAVLNLNAGVFSTPCELQLEVVIVNRTGTGLLDVEDLSLFRVSGVGADGVFTIREGDLISNLTIGDSDVTIEGPNTFEALVIRFSSTANYQQEPGETEGLTVDSLSLLEAGPNRLNLGFDSQSAGGLDWVLRTLEPASTIESLINSGRIVVTGAEFEVVNDPATGFTFIQEVAPSSVSTSASALNVFRGISLTGGLAETTGSDDMYATYNPGFTLNSSEAPVWLIFDGVINGMPTSLLDLSLESNAGTPGLTITLEAFNANSGSYDVVGTQPASFNTDAVTTIDLSAGIADYVTANGAVNARIGWRQTGFTINFPWEVRVDEVVWESN